jgi:DNA-binding transcriptional LysR family regulator
MGRAAPCSCRSATGLPKRAVSAARRLAQAGRSSGVVRAQPRSLPESHWRKATVMSRTFDPVTLKLFVAVCEERNIARAAAREALVASAVSKRIGAIEQELGTALLVRGRRGIEPTAAGQTLLRQAREVLAAMDRMHAELSEFASGVQGSVRVVASASALAEWLPEDIAAFLDHHHAVRVSVDERNSEVVVREVREGAADLGLAWETVDVPAGLQRLAYRADHLGVVMPPTHPLARRRKLRFADTLDHPTIGVSPGGLLDRQVRRQAALLGRDVVQRMQVSSLDAGVRIVAAGLGVAILPFEASSAQVAASGLVMLPLAEPWAERRFVIVAREDPWLSATARLLLTHLVSRAGA